MENNQNMFLDWNDAIENAGQEFVTLPEGDYNFRVTGFERGRFPGSAKLPACNKASLTLDMENNLGIATCRVDLILYRTLEWRISAFFRAIGQKKSGEKLVMDWNKVIGAQGRAHFKPRSYKDKNGNDREANDVERFIDYDPKFFADNTPDWVREAEKQAAQPMPVPTQTQMQAEAAPRTGWGGEF